MPADTSVGGPSSLGPSSLGPSSLGPSSLGPSSLGPPSTAGSRPTTPVTGAAGASTTQSPARPTSGVLGRAADATTSGGSNAESSKGKSRDGSAAPDGTSPQPKKRPTSHDLHLDQYVTRDHLAAAALVSQSEAQKELILGKRIEAERYNRLKQERMANPIGMATQLYGPGYQGYGNGFTESKARVVYPMQRRRPGGRRAKELRLGRKELQQVAETREELVPIRLDIDVDKIKLRDTFTWNLHDKTVPVELFAEQLVEDFHLPLTASLVKQVADSIQEQLNEYHPHVHIVEEPLDPSKPYWAHKNDDMRILIKLNITIGQHTLVDQFEWDINNPANSPEEFAQLLTKDLGLCGEFTTAIAHSIREQCQQFTRALYVTGHPFDGRPVDDEDVRTAMLPSPLPSVVRTQLQAKDYSPTLFLLSEADLERVDKAESREARKLNRQRRVNRRGGPTIPDLKDLPKTHRSQIVSSILPGAARRIEDLEKTRKQKLLKEGESDEEESESEGDDLPPEKAIRGWENMTRRQRMAAQAALSKQQTTRSQTPEVHSLPSRHERQMNREREREREARERAEKDARERATATAEPEKGYSPLPRRNTAAPGEPSALLTLKMNKSKFIKLLGEIDRRNAIRSMEEQRKRQEDSRRMMREERDRKQREKEEKERNERETQGRKNAEKTKKEIPAARPPAPCSNPALTSAASTTVHASAGAVVTTTGTNPGVAPISPPWLLSSLEALRATHPSDRFEDTMRSIALDPDSSEQIPASQIPSVMAELQQRRKELNWQWVPRIRCLDCPGKLYTPGPGETCENFVMHLRNRGHRQRVEARSSVSGGAGAGAGNVTN